MKDLLKTSSYDYVLPKELIASYPENPPENAKLLVYNRKNDSINHVLFKDLFDFLTFDTAILLNDTKVIKARIFGQKISGGKIEILLNSPLNKYFFKAYIRGKVKISSIIQINNETIVRVQKLFDDGTREISFEKKGKVLSLNEVYSLLEEIGHVPLPPYIKRDDEKNDERDYQTLFAKKQGSVAAPTASLHFSKDMLEYLYKQYKNAFITLHVGAGTFKPIDCEDISSHHIHEEYFSISNEAKTILESRNKILAVGTTVTRVIEHFARTKELNGYCQLFLHPKNPPKRVDCLLTNFHLPKSTLLMLVSSFVGLDKTLDLYKEAISKKYRFFSYGDAMLVL